MNKKLETVLAYWGFNDDLEINEEDVNCETERESHVWTINKDYILKMTSCENEMKNNTYIANLLLREGIPAQRVISNLNGGEYVTVENRYYGLFTKLKGEVIKDYFEGDYLKRAFYLGQCVGELHKGLKNITSELVKNKKILDNNMTDELSGWVSEEIDKYVPICKLPQGDIEAFNKIYIDMKKNFEELYIKLPRQIIHRDFHGGNMIFDKDRLVGYIDFDLCQINARIYDVCYLCTGVLSGIFDDIDKRKKWIRFAKKVVNGYKSETNITIEEKKAIKYMFFLIELIIIAYFAGNSYTDVADTNIKMINWINSNWENE